LVLGQIQGSPASVRILAHLIRLPEQTHITVARIDCNPAELMDNDPLRAESDFARQIATRFHSKLTGLT
jgi:hypothetical protein